MEQGGRSVRYLVRAVLFVAVVVLAAGLFASSLIPLFEANPPLNGIILLLLVVGLADVFRHFYELVQEDRYLDRVENYLSYAEQGMEPPERANEAILYGDNRSITEFMRTLHQVVTRGYHHATLPYLLDSLGERAESRRSLPRYLAGTLIVLGLLGTFWGLLQTVQGVQGIIGTLSAEEYDNVAAFVGALRERMADPIAGMALAFSTSLFGLGSSLVLGFTETQLARAVAHGQTRVEEIIVTDLLPFWREQQRPRDLDMEAEDRPAYQAALLEGIGHRLDAVTEQMDRLIARQPDPEGLNRTLDRSGETLRQELHALGNRLDQLEDQRNRNLREAIDRLARVMGRQPGDGGNASD
ncbi:hypothetical protein [Thiohalorhabdus denitrificans]|uniref:MotA/TolQ/ExbB proton channel family protein n=1 Tax=Thiohalorhabdus denitrificans TaxID=381306 RepID=A0A1G5EBX8_9GAMM|nr:hypothetical protein [Thiohalorhabdus denitrificans]SCY24415.1 hypothetical protein SAMN05661077_1567 [Thiohalorhabdus denitrificans]